MDRFSTRSQRIGPKVHRNRKLEDKWGTAYHYAVQDIVFGKQCTPYTPTEPPLSLCEEITESDPLYVCKHCRDCFRFKSSFEDHNVRHSWILGLWCYVCYETVCGHMLKTGTACTTCSACTKKIDATYFRERGSNKPYRSQGMGIIKVFYNQCQFIEHLKMHRLSSVNLRDLLLMPLPLNMSSSDWSFEFEVMCEALMERSFLSSIHIIDWLKMKNLEDSWWKLVDGKCNDSTINIIVDGYRARYLFELDKRAVNFNYSSNVIHGGSKSSSNIELIDDDSMDKNTNSYSTDTFSDKNILENEDNPCTPTDITFVDCGPTSQCFEPEIPMNYVHKQVKESYLAKTIKKNNKALNVTFKDRNSLETDTIHENAITVKAGDNGSNKNFVIKQSFKDCVQQTYKGPCLNKNITAQPAIKKTAEDNPSKLITKTDINKISDSLVKIGIPFSAKKSNANLDHSGQSLQTSNSKILTIQDPKNIASIINQIPPHFISNQKVVVIGQDSCNIIAHSENEMAAKKDSRNLLVDNGGSSSNMSTQKICDSNVIKQEIIEKIIIKDGKKYLIKQTKRIIKDPKNFSNLSSVIDATKATKQLTSEHNISNPSFTSINSNNDIENVGIQQTPLLHKNISFLTPSPSPSELSSCSSELGKTLNMPKLQKMPPHLISILPTPSIPKYISETILLTKDENGDLYMNIKEGIGLSKDNFLSVCDIITKYRREMFDEFHQMNSSELKERLDHLQRVTEEMKQVLNFISETVFKEKLRAVNILRNILEECSRTGKQDIQDTKSNDAVLSEWETRVDPTHKCSACKRVIKPTSYIPGFSKLCKNDNEYCPCYKQVCHECLSYHGPSSEFIKHQNFHKRNKPYDCPDCVFKFDSIPALEIHTWTSCFHPLRRLVFTCKICEIDGFRDLESITRHFAVMHSKTKVGCEDCLRVFTSYSEYVKHCTETHPSKIQQNPVRLVICKLSNVILRCENYITYLEKYSGIRKILWFKCPFCRLITTDNKHVKTLLNTHLRDNHVQSLSKILSKEAFTIIFGSKFLKGKKNFLHQFMKETSRDTTFRFTDETLSMNTVMPKIVNTRTISSETFERGSQNMEHTWSTATNVNESSQTMKKIDNKKEKELLPRIINVRSMNNSKSLKSKRAITTFFSTDETEMKTNSPFLQVAVKTDDEKVDPFVHEETAMELDNDKFNIKELAKTKEYDKDNNELIMNASHISESEKSLLIGTVDACINSPVVPSEKISNSTFEANTDSRIKVVDFRKICKPDIEQFVIQEMGDAQIKDENASYMASMPKPPQLARIPQYLLTPIKANKPIDASEKSKSTMSLAQRIPDKSKVRIALGTDTQNEGDTDYLCHLCNERINISQFVMQAHFREKHSDEYRVAVITPQLSRLSPDFIDGGYKQFINNKKRKSDSALFAPKRKRRWTPRKHIEVKDANLPVGLCVQQETAEDGEGNFICKKCGQRCADMSNLREHIATNHRLKGRYLICLECGENFVVAPSLQMHLKAFHGIEDTINYMNQNPSYAPSFEGDLETGERTTVANQCHVCMAVFEDKAAVDKHLRVHGMAFLNRKRIEARNALEKKANTEEPKQNIKDDSKEIAKRDKPAETILEKINAAI